MKIVKKILIVIAVLLLLISAIGLIFFPAQIHVERSVVINKDVSTVYEQISNLKNFQSWSPWYDMDTTASYTYSGPESGAGQALHWDSKEKNVGKGSLTIAEVVEDSMVNMDLAMAGGGEGAKAIYTLTPEGDATKMTWSMDMNAGMNPLMRIMGKFMDGMVGPDFEKGLNKLKARVETMPSLSSSITVEEVEVDDTEYLFVHGKANINNISQFLGASYGKIGAALGKQKLQMAGAPFAIYYSNSQTEWEMDAAIPVSGPGKDDGEIKAGKLKAGKAVMARFFGSYEQTGMAHQAANEFIKKNNKQVIGAPWEVYVTDPMVEKDTAKWETDIFYPVQ